MLHVVTLSLRSCLLTVLAIGIMPALITMTDGSFAAAHSTKTKSAQKSGKRSAVAVAAVRYTKAMAAGDRVVVGRLDFACQFRIVSATEKGLKSFPKESDPMYRTCWNPIEHANAEPVDRRPWGVHALWPGKDKLLFFSEDLTRHGYPPSSYVSPLIGTSTGIDVKTLGTKRLGFASFRIRPGEEIVGAPATLVQLRINYKDPLTSPVTHAPGTYQWASTVKRPRAALRAVTLNWVVLSNLKKLGFPGNVAVVSFPVAAATPTRPAVPFLTQYSSYDKNSAEWWGPKDSADLLLAAVGRAAQSSKLRDRVAMLNRVLIIDPKQPDALTTLTRDLYQAILDDGAAAHKVTISDKALASRFTEFYWDTYAQGARVDISLDMEMGGFSEPTTADYLFRMIPAMETLAEVRPDDLENRFRLGAAYRWNLDQLPAIETHEALLAALPRERASLRARALTELAWSRITKAAFNRTFDDPGVVAALQEAEEAFQLSDRPMDRFVAAYTMAYSLCFTPERDNHRILELLTEAKRWYMQVPGASEESWWVLLANDTLKPVIDADPALQQLVAAGDRG